MKQRLVGAIVLGCLAIIFIPILLDGEGVTPEPMTRNIPPAPPIPEVPRNEPSRPIILSDTTELDVPEEVMQDVALDIDVNEEVEEEIIEAFAQQRPQLGQQGLPETWSVRLGSFGEEANAQGLVVRLIDADYKAYSRVIDSSQGPLTAVYVGPVLTRSDAGTLQRELEESFGMEGIIVEFAIETLEQ